MKITTKSGAVYTIDDHGICRKIDHEGYHVSSFKVFSMKAVPTTVKTMSEVLALPQSEPEVGKLLYVSGMCDDWLSTEVVSIEGELSND